MKRYAVLNQNDLLVGEGKTLAEALGKADSLGARVYDRKTGAQQCKRCGLFKCDHPR